MKKYRFLVLLIILFSFFRYETVDAATVNVTNGGTVSYGSWSTHRYYEAGSSTYNMYCVQPNLTAVYGTQSYEEVTNNSGWGPTVKALYYSYDAPGWDQAMKDGFYNCLGVGKSDGAGQYAYSHVILSYFYEDEAYYGNWTYGVPSGLVSNIRDNNPNAWNCGRGDIICLYRSRPAPPSTFHVYIIRKPYNQNLIFWRTIPEEKGNIVVTKKIEGASTAAEKSPKGYKFKLYSDKNCKNATSYGQVTTGADGKAKWTEVKLGTYYIGETTKLDDVKWEDKSKCVKVTLSKLSPKVNKKYTASADYTNRRKWYATKVYKTATIQDINPQNNQLQNVCTGKVNNALFRLWRNNSQVADTAEAKTGGAVSVVHANASGDKRSALYESTNCNATSTSICSLVSGTL